MKVDCLVKFLYKWTNYHYTRSYNESLGFRLFINYMENNHMGGLWTSSLHDDEAYTIIEEERLIHPVILAQEIQKRLKELNKDFRELYYEYGWAGQIFEDFCLMGEL